ncbi:cyclopropane mycolic acid synthase family methyltransferase [Mycobacterium branderi]|uniref:SAM-dependent methyltransferase n=1 Tax=Mycobacterium branderi TaxID=43348 RepID=A0A7I7WDJ0_9MYCO|nr:cyclopropane mycolic acid synthase family methyltransferase [Mycobacterium branderi]MCV7235232.1 class I SAM-dependent methyltransferase [Mycobacterium branderi]ORA31874.1 SAM-dependent methyltransferase [Mycobacterium branderi]BBZ15002.1 SAM-dependent methyltransferase [Mycobacterium branderi]
MAVQLMPQFENVQAHYDLSDDFFRLFLDPTQTYSCAYFERDDMTLQQAQLAKIDLALGKLGLQPGMTLLDIGCGWGAAMKRAIEHYDVNVVGLTLSKNQAAHVQTMFDEMDTACSKRVLLTGWEEFREPVDRIVSIGAFEHFGIERYPAFFKMAYEALPADGVMLLHTIVRPTFKALRQRGLRLTHELVHFCQFILAEVFPGGYLPPTPMVEDRATEAGFTVARIQSLQPHYARTLDSWAANLQANMRQALSIQSQGVYDRYMTYLTGCAQLFRDGYTDVCQLTLQK